jgi:hypothetical protein
MAVILGNFIFWVMILFTLLGGCRRLCRNILLPHFLYNPLTDGSEVV